MRRRGIKTKEGGGVERTWAKALRVFLELFL